MHDFDQLTDQEKLTMTLSAFKQFMDSLGPNDIYKQILLEEVFAMLLGEDSERISIHDKT